ncbi:MAG: FecR family protein [Candidatus Peregrinibacteria bacterium]
MPFPWESIGKKVHPKSSFREHLRADIYELATKNEERFFKNLLKKISLPVPNLFFHPNHFPEPFSWENFFTGLLNQFRALFRHPFIVWPGIIAAMLLIVPILFSPASQQSIAMSPTLVRDFSGSFSVKEGEKRHTPKLSEELYSGEVLETGENSFAEIVFFEGSVLRMDENSILEIKSLTPHPLFLEAGAVEVSLKKGRAWGTTFQNSLSGLGIVLHTSDATLSPERASFDISLLEGKTKVRVFFHSLSIKISGMKSEETWSLAPHQELVFSPLETPVITPLVPAEQNDSWITKNQEKDTQYRKEVIEHMTAKMQENLLLSNFSDGIQGFFEKKPTDEEITVLFSRLNDALILASAGEKNLSESSLQEVSKSLPLLENMAVINGKIAEGVSISSTLLDEQTLPNAVQPVKGIIRATQKRIVLPPSQNTSTPVVSEGMRKNSLLPSSPPNDGKADAGSGTGTVLPEVLDSDLSGAAILQKKRETFYDNASESFRDQVDIYDLSASRENQAKYLLGKIEATPENLELLKTIEKDAPKDVKRLVKEKRRIIEEKIN